jgi:arylsulfatase A-like enzyme
MGDRLRCGLAALTILLTLSLLPVLAMPAAAGAPPSFVVIVTDDMRAADWEALPQTRALLTARGAWFENFFVTTSLCCPSRTSLLTGQYVHNHGVTSDWSQFAPNELGDKTISWALDQAGYRTALIGKYLNGFPDKGHVPPGWDRVLATGNGSYYDVVLNDNGRRHHYGKKRYELDVLNSAAQQFLSSLGPEEPFFLYFAPKAPHVPAIPPKRTRTAFANAAVERTPDLNEADVSDKPWHIRSLPLLRESVLDTLHRKRLRTLLALDDTIVGIWNWLEDAGRLSSTYVFVLSDNGYTIGNHRRIGKTAPYDGSVHVPMAAFGPGFAAGSVDKRLVANIDLAPTIAAAAGAALPAADGISLLSPLERDALLLEWRYVPAFADEDFTAESRGRGGNHKHTQRHHRHRHRLGGSGGIATGEVPDYLGLRTLDTLYVEYRTGERELYTYENDPYELDNLLADWEGHVPTPAAEALAATLAERMEALHDCAGASCR